MFVILLTFSERKSEASRLMADHNNWIAQGFAEGVFLLTGRITQQRGGAILAHNASIAEIQDRVAQDPFVAENVVKAEILEIAPGRTDERLAFLKDASQ